MNFFKKFFKTNENNNYNFVLPRNYSPQNNLVSELKPLNNLDANVFENLKSNLEYIKVKYNFLINSDIKIRDFTFNFNQKTYSAFIVFIDGMADSEIISKFILHPLMDLNSTRTPKRIISSFKKNNAIVRKIKSVNLENSLYNTLLPQNDISKKYNFKDIASDINKGNCALFIDTLNVCFVFDVKNLKQRSISQPSTELVVNGSQESFVEVLRTNTSLLRRLVNNENLIIENVNVGMITQTDCAICYIKGIANDELVAEVKYRINSLKIDSLISSGQLQHLIEDNPSSSLPQSLSTERPDSATSYLLEGRVIVIVNGTPFVLAMPATFIDFLTSAEDSNLKFQFANLLKVVRLIGLALTVLLPGLYIAITNFHQELIPSELLFAIVASRNSVPFPIIFELILMELSFELIREAGIRVPSPLGSTISLVGGLVLGDAAVSAGIVSPISIIIVAITGIASFALPDFSLSFHFRLSRFIYIILGYSAGFLGIAFGIFIHLATLTNIESFGVPYLSPYAPITKSNHNGYFLSPLWKRDKRPDAFNTKRKKSQNTISMNWKKGSEN